MITNITNKYNNGWAVSKNNSKNHLTNVQNTNKNIANNSLKLNAGTVSFGKKFNYNLNKKKEYFNNWEKILKMDNKENPIKKFSLNSLSLDSILPHKKNIASSTKSPIEKITKQAPELSLEQRAELRAKRRERKLAEKEQKVLALQKRIERQIANAPINTKDDVNKTIDVLAKGAYPANVLSNYNRDEVPFILDGIPCHSIEGFMQAIKQPDIEIQKSFCLKSGASARHLGQKYSKLWKKNQTLHWQGKEYKRDSKEYQELVRKVFNARFEQSQKYREALKDSLGYELVHTCGKQDVEQTVLTENEFVKILDELRAKIQQN